MMTSKKAAGVRTFFRCNERRGRLPHLRMVDQESLLIEAAQKGAKEAFSQIVRLHQVQVRAFLSKYVPLDDVVDDLAQETFLAAYRSLANYKAESPLRTWLLGIARHRALRYLDDFDRRRSRETGDLESALAGHLARRIHKDAEDVSAHVRRVSALEKCVEGLPETSARMVAEFYFKGQSAAAVARLTGKSEGAVRVTLMRIRQALSQCVQLRLRSSEAL